MEINTIVPLEWVPFTDCQLEMKIVSVLLRFVSSFVRCRLTDISYLNNQKSNHFHIANGCLILTISKAMSTRRLQSSLDVFLWSNRNKLPLHYKKKWIYKWIGPNILRNNYMIISSPKKENQIWPTWNKLAWESFQLESREHTVEGTQWQCIDAEVKLLHPWRAEHLDV